MPLVRVGPLGRGGGRALNDAADAVLRPALEAAVAVARAGAEDKPVRTPPAALRPFLRFAKLPARALAATRKVLEDDDEFRHLVAEAVSEEEVGRAGWLFLTRPPGWEDELAALAGAVAEAGAAEAERRAEHDARRRLAGAEAAARRAEESAAAARADAAQAAAAAAEERKARHAAVERAGALAGRLRAAERERDAALSAAGELRAEVDRLAAEVRTLSARVPPEPEPEAVPDPEAEAVPVAVPEPEPAAAAGPRGDVPDEHPPFTGHITSAAAAALAAAGRAAADLGAALAAAAEALVPPPPAGVEEVATFAPAPASRPPAPRRLRRTPAPLPPAVFDDSVEAAEHLVRLAGVALIVDGYNASLEGWPDVPIAEQRRRLVDALGALSARAGTDVRVVFDGADEVLPGVAPPAPRGVRVTFSPPGVEADDVIARLARDLPPERPVVVASSDRRVRDDAARSGANLLSSAQLLAVLRR